MRALGWGFLEPFDLISNSPWNCSTDTWCAAGILLKLGLGAWLDQRPACPSIKMKKSKLSHWTWEIEREECHFSFKTEQKLSHPDEHLFYNPVAQSTKIRKIAQIYHAGMIKPQRLKIKILVIISTTFPKKCEHFADFSALRVVHYGLKRRINCNLAEQCIISYKLLKKTVNCPNKLKELILCFSS